MIDKSSIIAIRNYINREVLEKTKLTKLPSIEIFGGNYLYGKKLLEKCFLHDRLQDKFDYIVFVDEDCFIYNENVIFDIINDMEENDMDICGMPDGGVSLMRHHRNDVPNLFFTVFKCKKIREISESEYNEYTVPCDLYESDKTVSCDAFEPYYKMLCFLRYELKMNFMALNDISDDYCQVLNGNTMYATTIFYDKNKLCIHCWYSRKYDIEEVKNRINKILNKALNEQHE